MHSRNSVAVVIINWNSGDRTANCLRSLTKLTYRRRKLILVDNGSSDGSREALEREFTDVDVVRNPTNLGFTGGVNAGFRRARLLGVDYYLALNNDTVVAPDLLDLLIEVAESDPNIGGLNPMMLYMQPADRIWHARGHYNWWTGLSRSDAGRPAAFATKVEDVDFLTGCALMVRAPAAERVGLLDDRFFIYCEDLDYSRRLLDAGYRLVFVPQARLWHQEHGDINENASAGFRVQYTTRNRLLLMSRHASRRQWLTFLPVFAIWFVGARLVAYILRRQWDRIPALISGIRDFQRLRRMPPIDTW
jgi:GT2 family glycosyltransferase